MPEFFHFVRNSSSQNSRCNPISCIEHSRVPQQLTPRTKPKRTIYITAFPPTQRQREPHNFTMDPTDMAAHEPQQPDPALTKAGNSTQKVRTESQTAGAQRPPLNRFTTSHENVLQEHFIGAIDQGTTSSRFIIFDGVGQPVAMHQLEFKQMYPQSG